MKKDEFSFEEEKKLLTATEESKVIEAIKLAEKQTSGEIRVHISNSEIKEDSIKYIESIFEKHRMFNTKDRNAVLFYLSIPSKKVFIYGDKGINKVVSDKFWNDTINSIIPYFKEQKFCDGICHGLNEIGELLKEYFPYRYDDINELDDDITYS